MGQRMLKNMPQHGYFWPSTAWDPSSDACESARKLHPDLIITTNPAAAINNSDVDMVYIATPPKSHGKYALMAAKAGKAVYCEKPLGTDSVDSRILVEKMTLMGARAIVNFSLASAPAVNALQSAINDGSAGTVNSVDILLHFGRWPRDWQQSAKWLNKRAEGGFTRETFSHYAYLTQRLFGKIDLLRASTIYPTDDTCAETHAMALMDCTGIPIKFNGGTGGIANSGADRIEYIVWGSKKVYKLYNWNQLSSSDGRGWVRHLKNIADTRVAGYFSTLDNVREFFRGEHHSMPSLDDALKIQDLVESILVGGDK
tara:strand:+ start:359 stop:1300 length:942 start_codon:yes stop_codon:yes gene_type:complete